MEISSRTPEGDDNQCAICGKPVVIEPSQPSGDAPCPHCGCLLWFGANSSLLGDSSEDLSEQEVASMLQGHPISMQVIEMIPESIARENTIIPIALHGEELWIAAPGAAVNDDAQRTLKAMEFILDRDIRLVQAAPRIIHAAIEKHYVDRDGVESCWSIWVESPDDPR
jgi:MshEN domain